MGNILWINPNRSYILILCANMGRGNLDTSGNGLLKFYTLFMGLINLIK